MVLQSNAPTTFGTPIVNYVEGNWDACLWSMGSQGTHGDCSTLQSAPEMFNVQVLIISTMGPDATPLITPSNMYHKNFPLVILGQIVQGHGEHYVTLNGPVSQYTD